MSAYLKTAVLAVLAAILYHDVLLKLVMEWWRDPNYSHGFVVPLVSLLLIWRKKDVLIRLNRTREPRNSGLLLMAAGLCMLIVGRAGSELYLQRFSMIVVAAGLVLLFYGKKILRAVTPALAFLVFMIPIPYILYDTVSFPLKLLTSYCAAVSLDALSIPVLREGNLVHLAGTTLEVADACSGIRSLSSLFALGAVFAFIVLKQYWKRALVILLVVPVAVAANTVRVVVTGILAHLFGGPVAEGFFHEYAGLVIFLVSLMLLMGLCLMIRGSDETLQRPGGGGAARVGSA